MVANFAGQAWAMLMMIAFVPVFIRYLGLEAYGLIGLFMTLQMLLALFDAGMSPTLNREMARYTSGALALEPLRDLLRSVETVAAGLAATIALAALAAAGPASRGWLNLEALDAAEVARALAIMGTVLGLRILETLYRSALLGLQLQVWFNGANALLNTLRHGGAALVVALVAPDITAYFLWYLGTSLLTVAVLRRKLLAALPAGSRHAVFSVPALVAIHRFALGMLSINLLAILLTQVDKLLLVRLLPLAQFGTYMLAFTIASALTLLTVAITQAWLPAMVERIGRGEGAALAEDYRLAAQLVAAVVVPAGLVLILWPADVVRLWSGDAVLAAEAAPLVRLLAAGSLLNALMTLPYTAMVAHGWTRLTMVANLVAVALLVPAILLVVPVAGAEGAAAIWVVLNAGYLLVVVPLMHRRILAGELGRWAAQGVALPLLAALAAGLLANALRSGLELPRPALLLSLGLGWALMLAALLVVSGRLRTRYAPMLRRRR
jgi:O-antigen/teichoic acid export membrane protein